MAKFFKYTFLILAFFCVVVVVYLENSISVYISKERFDGIVEHMKKTEKLPDNFYEVINKYQNRYMERSVWSAFFNTRLLGNKKHCSCEEIYVHPGFVDNYSFPAVYVVQLELYDRLGSKKCYDYLVNDFKKSLNIESMNDFAMKQFSKTLDQLTDRQILTVDLFVKNMSNYYTYQKDSTCLDKKLDTILK